MTPATELAFSVLRDLSMIKTTDNNYNTRELGIKVFENKFKRVPFLYNQLHLQETCPIFSIPPSSGQKLYAAWLPLQLQHPTSFQLP